MNRIRIAVLAVACVGFFCVALFTESAAENTLEVTWQTSDLEDALDFLAASVPIRGKSACVSKVKASKTRLSASLRKKDTAYQVAYKKLRAKDKASRGQYALTKEALSTKVAHATHSCKHRFAAKLEAKDKKYLAAYNKLLKNPKLAAAKAKLKKDMAALMKLFKAAISGKSKAKAEAIRHHFDKKFKAVKEASSYYRAAKKLRETSKWYPQYKKQKGAHVQRCKKRVRSDVKTALGLLKGKSVWYKDYSKLISKSQWYKQYKASIANALSVCEKTGKTSKARKVLKKAKKKVKKKAKKAKKEAKKEKEKEKKKKKHAKRKAKKSKKHHEFSSTKKVISALPFDMKDKVAHAIKKAKEKLSKAKSPKQKAAAKKAVKEALAAAGVVDADNAGTVAWAKQKLDKANKWADRALARDARSLSKVAAWQKGERKLGKKARRSCEHVVQAMIAVARSTRNAEMATREAKLRHLGKLKSFAGPIKAARASAHDAFKAVQNARAALSATLGTKSRMAAHHALQRAESAVHDANKILKIEVSKRDSIETNRLRSDGVKLAGENELHYEARKTFHRANRVLKKVIKALDLARKNHFAHKEAHLKKEQRLAMQKAKALARKEAHHKREARRKALGIKTKEEYAAKLAGEALKAGQKARAFAVRAAAAGKKAAEKAMETAEVKAELFAQGHKGKATPEMVAIAVKNEAHSAYLASRALQMLTSVVSGNKVPKGVQVLVEKHAPGVHVPSPEELTAGTRAEKQAARMTEAILPSNREVSHWLDELHKKNSHGKKKAAVKTRKKPKKEAKVHKRRLTIKKAPEVHKKVAKKTGAPKKSRGLAAAQKYLKEAGGAAQKYLREAEESVELKSMKASKKKKASLNARAHAKLKKKKASLEARAHAMLVSARNKAKLKRAQAKAQLATAQAKAKVKAAKAKAAKLAKAKRRAKRKAALVKKAAAKKAAEAQKEAAKAAAKMRAAMEAKIQKMQAAAAKKAARLKKQGDKAAQEALEKAGEEFFLW